MLASAEVARPSEILCGLDPNGAARRAGASHANARDAHPTQPLGFDASITPDAVYRELEEGRCPVCSAVGPRVLGTSAGWDVPAYEPRGTGTWTRSAASTSLMPGSVRRQRRRGAWLPGLNDGA